MAKSKLTKSQVKLQTKILDVSYIGNGAYCYANSTAMLLSTIGENIPSSKIEVLSGVGLGAFIIGGKNLLFFSWVLPDEGVNRALNTLGFGYKEKKVPKTEPPPLEELRSDLVKSPAVLGPLDMGYLVYNPNYQTLHGADHFILVYDMDDKEVHLHDPAGFPHVSLKLDQLKLAWKSEKIAYGKDFYRYWTSPKRTGISIEEKIYNQAIKYFKAIYQESEKKAVQGNLIVGCEAILACANRVQDGKTSQNEIAQLAYFALPLGAKRALDFASFFEFRDADLAALKRKQAKLFGKCHTFAVAKDWIFLAKTLQKLADVEEKFRTELLNK